MRDASRVEEAGKPRALKPYGVIILPDRETKPKIDDRTSRSSTESTAAQITHPLAADDPSSERPQERQADDEIPLANRPPDLAS
ncbi:MAG TPA: hypothetical protein VLA27_10960 [Paracoccaceae bacterium]|nr:hypothetical protein [Paracoccaceae bacterium]